MDEKNYQYLATRYLSNYNKSGKVPKLLNLNEALHLYRISVQNGVSNLISWSSDFIKSKLDRHSCLYILVNLSDMNESEIFKRALDFFAFFFDEIAVSSEWKEMKRSRSNLCSMLLYAANTKEFNTLAYARCMEELNSMFDGYYLQSNAAHALNPNEPQKHFSMSMNDQLYQAAAQNSAVYATPSGRRSVGMTHTAIANEKCLIPQSPSTQMPRRMHGQRLSS